MKNFKKVLALVLAVATVFTFAAMATAAEVKYDDFTDTASISHVEAVQVLTGVGVINGFEDKTFKPAESVTRVQMAKMVGYIMNDGDDINDLYKAACPFADSKSNWGAGYIAYCATQGIVNGRDANTFDPNATVTGTEAAKMLLCALGYDATIEGFTGADWATNVLTVAKKAGLLKELSQSKMGVALNREDAAQMIFNALKTAEVEYENKGTQITINGATIATGASSAKKVTGVHKGFDGDVDDVILWGEDHFVDEEDSAKQLSKGNSTDAFNVTATVWYYGKDSDGAKVEISKDLKLAKKFVGSMTAADLYALVGKLTVTGAEKDQDTLKFSLDGVEIKAANFAEYEANFKFGKQGNPAVNAVFADWADGDLLNNTTATQRGNSKFLADEIEVYVSDKDGEGRLIQVIGKTYSIGYVSKFTAAKLASEDDKIEVTREAGLALANKEFATTAFGKEDVENETKVIYTYSVKEGKIQSVKKVDAVKSGAVTKIDADSDNNTVITADGKTYTFKGKNADVKLNAEYDLFLDPNGKVLLAEETKAGTSNYYMVLKRANPVEGSGLDAADTVYQIRLLGADGKTVDLNVAEINGDDDVAKNWKDDVLKPATAAKEGLDIATAEVGTIVTYTLNSKGEAKLTTAGFKADDDFDAEAKGIVADYEDLTNIATMLTKKKATSDTTFVLISLDKNDNYVFTPVSGIAAMKAALGNYEYKNDVTVEVKSAANVAKPDVAGVAFIFVEARNVTSTKTVFTTLGQSAKKTVQLTGKTDRTVEYYEVTAIEGNEIKTLKVEKGEFDAKVKANFVLASSYTVDDDGFVTKITVANGYNAAAADKSALKYANGVLTIGDKEYTQENVNVFLYNTDTEKFSGSKVAKNMTDEVTGELYYYFNTNGTGTKTVVAIFAVEK